MNSATFQYIHGTDDALRKAQGLTFIRCARALAIAKGDVLVARSYAEAQSWSARDAIVTHLKAAVSPVSMAETLYGPVYDDLAEYLRPLTLVGKLTALQAVPFLTRLVRGVGGARAAWVSEGKPVPASHTSFEDAGTIEPRRISTIVVASMAAIERSSIVSERMLRDECGRAIVEGLDRAFIDPSSGEVTGERPASVSYGATQLNSTGSSIAAIDADLKSMMTTLTAAGISLATAAWCLHPTTAANMSLMRDAGGLAYPGLTANGGTLAGLPAVTSEALSAGGSPGEFNIVLLAQSEIDIADENGGGLSIAKSAAIQLDDAPSASASQLTSLWSAGLVGIMVSRFLNWQARRPGAVVTLRNVVY